MKTASTRDIKSHWNKIYSQNDTEKLGWYEESPRPSLHLIEKCHLPKHARVLNVGAGSTTLIDELIKMGYRQLIATDISEVAINNIKDRLGTTISASIQWIVDDLTNPKKLRKIPPVDLWHDRAVLHFFLTKKEQQIYFDLLKKLVKPRGYVIIAAFNLQGAEKCSGLPVFRYDQNMLAERLGDQFRLVEAFDYTYAMPTGDLRPYVYALYKRLSD